MLDYQLFKDINELFATGQMEKARHLLMEVQARFIALRDELAILKLHAQSMEEILYLNQNLYHEDGHYWLRTNTGRMGPFCQRCYEHDGILAHVEKIKSAFRCPCCQETVKIAPSPAAPSAFGHARILNFAR